MNNICLALCLDEINLRLVTALRVALRDNA